MVCIAEGILKLPQTIFTTIPTLLLDFVMKQTFGVEKGFLVKTLLGNFFKEIIKSETGICSYSAIQHCTVIISHIYAYTMMILIDIMFLMRGNSFNPWKKRMDKIVLEKDQVMVSAIIFALCFSVLTNIILYYLLFALLMTLILFLRAVAERNVSISYFAKDPRRFVVKLLSGKLFVEI